MEISYVELGPRSMAPHWGGSGQRVDHVGMRSLDFQMAQTPQSSWLKPKAIQPKCSAAVAWLARHRARE